MISVILPVYNAEKYLFQTLSSVINQSYQDLEVIVVNDGSTDDSFKMLSEFSLKDERIRIIDQSNSGPSKARNRGIELAKGSWIYFMDADDILDEDAFSQLMRDSSGYDMIVFGAYKHIINKSNEEKKQYQFNLLNEEIKSRQEIGAYLMKVLKNNKQDVFLYYIWNKIFSAEIIRKSQIKFNEDIRLGEDFIFVSEYLKKAETIRILDNCYYHYFLRGWNSLVGRFDKNELDRRKRMYRSMIDLYRTYNIYLECKDYLEIHEGKLSLKSLYRINISSCTLKLNGKLHYINGFIKDERRDYMVKYLVRKKDIKSRIKSLVIQSKNSLLVYCMIRKSQSEYI